MNNRLYWLSWLAVGLLSIAMAKAQVPADLERRYKAAIRLVQTANYERAKTEFNAIIQRGGSLSPYAHYYYALAAYKQKNFTQARLMLRQLMDRFPDWQKMDDARYLFAAVCMEMGQYEDALTAIERIGDPALRPEIDKLERHFLYRVQDLNRLKLMQKEFPDNRNLGLALIDLIQRSSSDKDDLVLSDRLTNRFGLPTNTPDRPGTTTTASTQSAPAPGATSGRPSSTTNVTSRPDRSRPKGYYNVAVMFPFRLNEFDAQKRARSNQYVFDLYNGIKMAKEKLKEEGIIINLFAYDVENDPERTQALVNSPAFAQTDLIIGPLYAEPNRIALSFAGQNNVLLINPIATSSELVAGQPMAYLAQPSVSRQAEKAVEFVRSLSAVRRPAIYYGASRRDSLLTAAYVEQLRKQGVQPLEVKKLTGTAQTIADGMKISETNVPGHVFLSSSNEDDGSRLIDALGRRRINVPVIATSSAFDFYKNSVSTFARRELYLLFPDYVDQTRPIVADFQEQYLAQRKIIPSVFASQGYDMMLFFGRQMAKNGTIFRNRSALRSDTDDYVLSGFDYTQNNENQVVPIVKWDGGRFVKVN
ncbi:hypothetical protein BN8_03046 [Fibrisoma limi BUZ 3]|uniref:Leucine-binding protein domain-containing protein n=1 Tax=Fibrisoma limi BUZ 3 TaxID=1185876 RepID=I2GJ39_9BACT|nr:CDC27 family protein [Fibrisoma limi]CCH53914.1 hypothetical protein BN8_03046 [Fibrisoma limi BUZ 3]